MLPHLDRKVLRDLKKMTGQAVAVALVMACGLAMLTMARSLIFSLESTRAEYYEANRFADGRVQSIHRNAVRAAASSINW